MIERPIGDIRTSAKENWSESKDQAYITYYLCELAVLHDEHRKSEERMRELAADIEKLNDTFGYLRAQYPEEFV